MSDQPFRKDALDGLISPDELDQAPAGFIQQTRVVIISTIILFLIAFVSAILIKIPVSIDSEGIIWTPEGVRQLNVDSAGIVEEVYFQREQIVKKGEPLALVDQSELNLQLHGLKSDHENLKKYIADLENVHGLDISTRKKFSEELNTLNKNSYERLNEKKERLLSRKESMQRLFEKGNIEQDRYQQFLDTLDSTLEALDSIKKNALTSQRDNTLSDLQIQKDLLQQKRALVELEQQIEELQRQILIKGQLLSPFSGKIVEVDAAVGDFLSPGISVGTIMPQGSEKTLQVIAYAKNHDGTKCHIGMQVEMELDAFPKDKYGVLIGEIVHISRLPSTTASMMYSLKNDQLVQKLAGEGAPFEFHINPVLDSTDASGYKWSSPSSKTRHIHNGMMCNAKITVRKRRLISLIIPEKI